MKIDDLDSWLAAAGALRWGVAKAEAVDPQAAAAYERWIAAGRHATMDYLERYPELRRDPRFLLPGAQSLVSVAFSYYSPLSRPCPIARYALGSDYHEVVRQRLQAVARQMSEAWGAECRVCVDTAPLPERYWAQRAGVGFIGHNRQLIVPGHGSYVFLGEIITTAALPVSEPCRASCGACQRCQQCCPTGALSAEGVDSARCLSYLTIEYRGEFPADVDLHGRLYGCDRCQEVCPHNRCPVPTTIPELQPRPAVVDLTPERVLSLTQDEYSHIMSHSAIKRAKLSGLQRNARQLIVKNRF
ncbi:MAG: tRNA epoxyqueuosine(34) reductase QueG [Bacteroidales bacterium]|nr:tRNA epoxyqueuosine(34) reductase QueG [Bacteroidales bacterium]